MARRCQRKMLQEANHSGREFFFFHQLEDWNTKLFKRQKWDVWVVRDRGQSAQEQEGGTQQLRKMRCFGGWGGRQTSKQRVGILDEWETEEKPEFRGGLSLLLLVLKGPFRLGKDSLILLPRGGVPKGISPPPGPPRPTLPYLSKRSSPTPGLRSAAVKALLPTHRSRSAIK